MTPVVRSRAKAFLDAAASLELGSVNFQIKAFGKQPTTPKAATDFRFVFVHWGKTFSLGSAVTSTIGQLSNK